MSELFEDFDFDAREREFASNITVTGGSADGLNVEVEFDGKRYGLHTHTDACDPDGSKRAEGNVEIWPISKNVNWPLPLVVGNADNIEDAKFKIENGLIKTPTQEELDAAEVQLIMQMLFRPF